MSVYTRGLLKFALKFVRYSRLIVRRFTDIFRDIVLTPILARTLRRAIRYALLTQLARDTVAECSLEEAGSRATNPRTRRRKSAGTREEEGARELLSVRRYDIRSPYGRPGWRERYFKNIE